MTQHYSDEDLRVLRDLAFGPRDTDTAEPDDTGEPQHNVVVREGANPPTRISDEAYNRDFARRLFDDEYDIFNPELPEPEEGTR